MASKVIGGMTVTIAANTAKLQKGLNKARSLIKRFSAAAKIGLAAASTAVVMLSKRFEEFNKSMLRSLSIMGNISKAMRVDMTEAAIKMASVTRFSAREAGEAYFFLASAGLSAAQSIKALPQVAQFAQAGNFGLARATDLATDAQAALGLTVKDASKNLKNLTRVTDVLVKANTIANASVEQFSESLTNKAGAGLRMLNKDMEEGIAVLAVYADQGVKGAEAGTALSIVMRDLQTKAIKFKENFKAAGIVVFDSAGKMRRFADIIEDLEKRFSGLSDAQKKATLLNLGFSDQSIVFMQQLIGASDKIKEYEKALRSAGGTTREVAGKMLTPMEKATAKLGAAFDRLAGKMEPIVTLMARIVELASVAAEIVANPASPGGKTTRASAGKRAGLTSTGQSYLEANRGSYAGGIFRATSSLFEGPRETKPSDKYKQYRNPQTGLDSARRATQSALPSKKLLDAFVNAIKNKYKQAGKSIESQEGLVRSIAKGVSDAISTGRGKLLSAGGRAQIGWLKLQRQAQLYKTNNTKAPAPALNQSRSSLAFTEAGTQAFFRQQARIKRQSEGEKLDKNRNKLLGDIKKAVLGTAAPAVDI